jgi:hypothetical protein
MKVSQQLKAAKAIIASPSKWLQGAYAKDADGFYMRGNNTNAVCFCSLGALQAVNQTDSDAPSQPAIAVLKQFMGGDVPEFNDSATHEQVLEAFDKAIAAAEEQEAA